jgi:hypothetical protein
MRVVFNGCRWRNFLSTGNVFTEMKLSDSPNTLVQGKNGHGKSVRLNTAIIVSSEDKAVYEAFKRFKESIAKGKS